MTSSRRDFIKQTAAGIGATAISTLPSNASAQTSDLPALVEQQPQDIVRVLPQPEPSAGSTKIDLGWQLESANGVNQIQFQPTEAELNKEWRERHDIHELNTFYNHPDHMSWQAKALQVRLDDVIREQAIANNGGPVYVLFSGPGDHETPALLNDMEAARQRDLNAGGPGKATVIYVPSGPLYSEAFREYFLPSPDNFRFMATMGGPRVHLMSGVFIGVQEMLHDGPVGGLLIPQPANDPRNRVDVLFGQTQQLEQELRERGFPQPRQRPSPPPARGNRIQEEPSPTGMG